MKPLYTIGVVSRRSGVSIGALRFWENEYGLLAPKRSAGGTRLYSDADVEQVVAIQRLVNELGYSLSSLAQVHDQVRFFRAPHHDIHEVVRRLVDADGIWSAARTLVEGARALTGVASARLALYRRSRQSLSFIATSVKNGTFRYACPPVEVARLPTAWQRALEKRVSHTDADLRRLALPADIRSRLERDHTRSLLAEPLTVGDRLVGILAVGGSRPGEIPFHVRDVCERLAVPAGPAIGYFAGQL